MGYKPVTICRMLREEGLIANRMGIHKFLQKHRETNNIERRLGSGRPTKMTVPVKALVEQQMRGDDETTAVQLHTLLLRHGHTMTLKTVLRCRTALGWTFMYRWRLTNAFAAASEYNHRSLSQRRIILRSLYLAMNRFRTVRPFRLNGWGVLHNGKGHSVFVSFRKNGTITLYCCISYSWHSLTHHNHMNCTSA